jgi:hypothetical protein
MLTTQQYPVVSTGLAIERTVKLPSEVDFELAAAALLQGMTAIVLTHEAVQVKSGDFVLVQVIGPDQGSSGRHGTSSLPDMPQTRSTSNWNSVDCRKGTTGAS